MSFVVLSSKRQKLHSEIHDGCLYSYVCVCACVCFTRKRDKMHAIIIVTQNPNSSNETEHFSHWFTCARIMYKAMKLIFYLNLLTCSGKINMMKFPRKTEFSFLKAHPTILKTHFWNTAHTAYTAYTHTYSTQWMFTEMYVPLKAMLLTTCRLIQKETSQSLLFISFSRIFFLLFFFSLCCRSFYLIMLQQEKKNLANLLWKQYFVDWYHCYRQYINI